MAAPILASYGIAWVKLPRQLLVEAVITTPHRLGANVSSGYTKRELVAECERQLAQGGTTALTMREAIRFGTTFTQAFPGAAAAISDMDDYARRHRPAPDRARRKYVEPAPAENSVVSETLNKPAGRLGSPDDYYSDAGRIFLALKSLEMFDLILACTANPDLGLTVEDKEIVGSLCEDYAMVDILENFIGLSENDGKRFSKALKDATTHPAITVTEETKARLARLREDAVRIGIDTIALSEGCGEATPRDFAVHVTTATCWVAEQSFLAADSTPYWRTLGKGHGEDAHFETYAEAITFVEGLGPKRPGLYRVTCRRETVRQESFTAAQRSF